MADIFYISTVLQVTLYLLILLLASVYSMLILLNRRYRHRNNIFILNTCLTTMISCIYFTVYFTMFYFDIQRLYAPDMCNVLFDVHNIASIGIPFAFVTFTVDRFCSIIYHTKDLFKRKRWVAICIASQWISECAVSVPFVLRKERVSVSFSFSTSIFTISVLALY
jgi:hypothetical protein